MRSWCRFAVHLFILGINMKVIRTLLVSCALSLAAVAHGQVMKPAVFNTVYVPGGFDSNDNVQIVGEGMFRNTCYRPAPTTVKVDHEKKVITLGPVAYEYSGLCLQVVLQFDRVVDVGILEPGTYTILHEGGGNLLGTVSIAQAKKDTPDEFLYAPISQAFFKQDGLTSEIIITGDFPSSCMSLDNVKVTLEPKVIVLQPIAALADRTDCVAGKFPFSKVVKVDLIPKGRYLLHVRSMNAKAINTLVDVNY